MLRYAVPVLAVFAMLAVATPAHAKRAKKTEAAPSLPPPAKIETADAQELLREGNDLWHIKKDYNGALAKFNAAVDAAPKDTNVRLQRAIFFEIVSGIVIADERKKFQDLAHDDYLRVSQDDPDSVRAGVARDGLTRLSGKALIEAPRVSCSAEARAAHERGESLFGAEQFAEAAVEHEKAAAACPASADFMVSYADAYYLLEQYEKAKELFTKALTIDPWNRAGHRVLADTEAKLENGDAVIRQLELAVISDPVYEAAWSSLRKYATVMGRKWNRAYGTKTVVTRGPDANGKQSVNIAVPTPKKSNSPDSKDGDDMLWIGYGMTKASVLGGSTFDSDSAGKPVERKLDPDKMSALEIERESVKSALQIAREVEAGSGDKPGPFWSMMARAEKGGYLDEAIFLHMLDAPLAAEYGAFREKNSERMVTYIDTLIVP
jgi:tetratricopeptide (TPR) repeat protein